MEKLRKEIEDCLVEELYSPLFEFCKTGTVPNIKSAPVVAQKLMSLLISLPNYGDEEDNYCSQEWSGDLKIDKDIGKIIKFYRKKRKLTQKKLGELIDKKEITIRKYESGVISPPTATMVNLGKALNININEFFNGMPKGGYMKIYVHKPTKIDAIQYTKESEEELKALLENDGAFEFTDEGFLYHGYDSSTPTIEYGDYVCFDKAHSSLGWFYMEQEEFERLYGDM